MQGEVNPAVLADEVMNHTPKDHGNDNNNDQMNLGEDDSGIEILAEAANLNEGNVNERRQ